MITQQVIDTLYKKYKKRPATTDALDLSLLLDDLADMHDINIDDKNMVNIGSIEEMSPWHTMPLGHIHAIVPFEKWVALVLGNSIVFLHRESPKANVHLKPIKDSWLSKLMA